MGNMYYIIILHLKVFFSIVIFFNLRKIFTGNIKFSNFDEVF